MTSEHYPCRRLAALWRPAGMTPPPQPLGPDSLTWKYFGDWRGMLQGPWAGSMQNMHPQLGAAVEQHSIFFMERMPRLFRSLYPIGGVVFDGDRAPMTGAEVRDYHIGIKGVDDQGRRYSALNPDVFYWAHATFFMGTILAAERFGGGLTEDQKRQLFDEHITWYRMYGMSMRPVPKTWEDFQVYWDHMCRNVLENNWAAREVLDLSTMPKHPSLAVDSGPAVAAASEGHGTVLGLRHRRPLRPAGARADGLHLVAPPGVAAPPVRRHRSTWSSSCCPSACGCTRGHAPAGTARPAGFPSDAPLVHTPARNLPPVGHRDNGMHYCPNVEAPCSRSTPRRRNSATGNGFADPGTSPAAPADSVRKPRADRR